MLCKQYKYDTIDNGVCGKNIYECKFYGSIDELWHQIRAVMKHVTIFANKSFDQPTILITLEKKH